MGQDVTVEVIGVNDLLKKLQATGANVRKAKRTALKAGAEVVKNAANPKAPGQHVEVGFTRHRGGAAKQTADSAEIFIGPDEKHWYYRFLEFGAGPHPIGAARQILTLFGEEFVTGPIPLHPGFPARPFLRPALDENRTRVANAIGDELRKAIEAVK